MVSLRRQSPVFGAAKTEILETYRPHLFAYCRQHDNGDKLLAVCNFSEHEQRLPMSICDVLGSRQVADILTGDEKTGDELVMGAYDVVWLKAK